MIDVAKRRTQRWIGSGGCLRASNVMFAIDEAAANDVMVFRMVRRSGLLYCIVSAAIRFDCLSEVVWLAANAARD